MPTLLFKIRVRLRTILWWRGTVPVFMGPEKSLKNFRSEVPEYIGHTRPFVEKVEKDS